MANTFRLSIFTPYGHYFDGQVEFLEVHSEEYNLGILPGHAPLISTVTVSKMEIKMNGKKHIYAVGGGVIKVDKELVTLLLDSIEAKNEIDVARAKEAKLRAEKRLEESKKNDAIDVSRAKLALLRAINRLNVSSKE